MSRGEGQARGYLFRFWASNLDPRTGEHPPLTDSQISLLDRVGKEAIDLIEQRVGMNVSGMWGPSHERTDLDQPIRFDHRVEGTE